MRKGSREMSWQGKGERVGKRRGRVSMLLTESVPLTFRTLQNSVSPWLPAISLMPLGMHQGKASPELGDWVTPL
jgi:hypothetical protein